MALKFAERIVDEWHHGSYRKLRILAVNELPECNKCFKTIENDTFIWKCIEDDKYYHYDCFNALDHPKTLKDGMHNDHLCRIQLKLKLFEEQN